MRNTYLVQRRGQRSRVSFNLGLEEDAGDNYVVGVRLCL
jgi:hypothetical protein